MKLLTVLLVFLLSCGQVPEEEAIQGENSESKGRTVSSSVNSSEPARETVARQSQYLKAEEEKPDCLEENFNHLIYVVESDAFYVCQEDGWEDVKIKGVNGKKGKKGDKGETGETGETGEAGETGDQGNKGLKGNQGDQGVKGDTGASGVNGTNGTDGVKGDTGSVGAKGDNGSDGATGSTGTTGTDGATGATGAKGDTGSAGTNGTDASAVTVVNSSNETIGSYKGMVSTTVMLVTTANNDRLEFTISTGKFVQGYFYYSGTDCTGTMRMASLVPEFGSLWKNGYDGKFYKKTITNRGTWNYASYAYSDGSCTNSSSSKPRSWIVAEATIDFTYPVNEIQLKAE